MTGVVSAPSKHLKAIVNVKASTHLLRLQNEGHLAAAGGDGNEQFVLEGFEWVVKKPQGHSPDLSWVSFNEPQSSCVAVEPQTTRMEYKHLQKRRDVFFLFSPACKSAVRSCCTISFGSV